MGANSPSSSSPNNFNPSQWQHSTPLQDPQILQLRSNPNQRIEQHSIIISDHQQLQRTQQLFILRNHCPQLVSAKYININKYDELCSQLYCGSIYTECIPLRLSTIIFLPFPDILHLYNQCLHGFHSLSKCFGYFKVNEDCIAINQQYVAKVWLSSNLAEVNPHSPLPSQEDMVRNIVEIIESNTNPTTMPSEQPSFSRFLYRSNPNPKFEQSKAKLQHYANTYNKGIIPSHLSSIQQSEPIPTTKYQFTNNSQSKGKPTQKQQTRKLGHCSSAHSLSTVDQATQTRATNQMHQELKAIGGNRCNSNKKNQPNQPSTYYHPKSKTKLAIHYLTQHPLSNPTTTTNQQHHIFVTPNKINQSLSNNPTSRSQSQSKLQHPSSKLDTQPLLIRSGTVKTIKNNANISLMTISEEDVKLVSNHQRNIHSISLSKNNSLLPTNQSTLIQSFSPNPKNQYHRNHYNHQFVNAQTSFPIQLKICQPIPLTTMHPVHPNSLHIPPLHFRPLNIKTLSNPSSYRFSFSSQKKHISIASPTHYSSKKSISQKIQKTQINKSNNEITHPSQNMQSSSKHHENLSIPVSDTSENPQLPHEEVTPLIASHINIQVPIQNNIIIEQNQPLQTQTNEITTQEQPKTTIQIVLPQDKLIFPQPNSQINHFPSPLVLHPNHQQSIAQQQQFPIAPSPCNRQLKIPAKQYPGLEFPNNQSISSIAFRQDQDCSMSYLDWENRDDGPKSNRKIQEKISEDNKWQLNWDDKCKERSDNKIKKCLMKNYQWEKFGDCCDKINKQQKYGQNENLCNKFNLPSPKQSSSTYLYNCPSKHDSGTVVSLAPTYSSSKKQPQKSLANFQLPTAYKTISHLPLTQPTIPTYSSHYKYFSSTSSHPELLQHRYSLIQDQPYNVEWDPEILADLRANMLRN